jgi:hypothetical protein
MKTRLRDRLAFWLESVGWFDRLLLKYDGEAPACKRRCINRINGHVVLR